MKTSWGKVASWYNDLLEKDKNSYQRNLILPNILRLLKIQKGERILDLACGQGFFSKEFARLGAKVTGVDISSELINIARQKGDDVEYHVSSADNLGFLKNESIDKVVVILALQNIENVSLVIKKINRILKRQGKLLVVLNHPAFRIPKASSWEWDNLQKVQYRRVDSYLSESKEQIQMHPGDNPGEKTISFHRPLQFYFKILGNNGLFISRLEEWNSHKVSEEGPRKEAEDRARREFPLFLFLEAIKFS